MKQGENSNKEFVILSCLNFSFDLNKRNVRDPYANINETDNFKHFLICARTATRDVTLRIGFLFRLAREKKVNITGKQLPYQKKEKSRRVKVRTRTTCASDDRQTISSAATVPYYVWDR